MPSLAGLENSLKDFSTQIISADGQLLGSLYQDKDRVFVRLEEIPKHTREALVATEDRKFYQHSGVDMQAVLSIFYSRLISRQQRGGSTITQQLSRNIYEREVGKDRSIWRKVKEAIAAILLERRYTKDEIMMYYFNTVSFGGTSYGIQAASKMYFNKPCQELEPHEGALLIALLKGPTVYSPYRYPERAKNRRNVVLSLMEEHGYLSAEKANRYKELPLGVQKYVAEQHNTGLAPHFREYVRMWLKDWCEKNKYNLYTDGLKVYTTIDSRLQAYAEEAMREHLSWLQTNFNRQIKGPNPTDTCSNYLDENGVYHVCDTGKEPWIKDSTILLRAWRQSARYKGLQGTMSEREIFRNFQQPVPMEIFDWYDKTDSTTKKTKKRSVPIPKDINFKEDTSGYIIIRSVTMSPWDSIKYYLKFLNPGILGIDPQTGEIRVWVGGIDHRFFQYDHVKASKRQVGSTFKPFVYAVAFKDGYSPCHQELNQPVEIETPEGAWIPKNSDGKYGGKMTLRKALATSTNTVTARLMKKLGPQSVVNLAHEMGIKSELKPVPSLGLGTIDLSVYELTTAYIPFANKGRAVEPVWITRIEDKNGNVIYRNDKIGISKSV
ncbi:MAG: transglycosylase domain-containing protein, partial [Bacteroidia bacterium]|nr:transglycosylase domain-containing protein [Bacteroidia bacterium]